MVTGKNEIQFDEWYYKQSYDEVVSGGWSEELPIEMMVGIYLKYYKDVCNMDLFLYFDCITDALTAANKKVNSVL